MTTPYSKFFNFLHLFTALVLANSLSMEALISAKLTRSPDLACRFNSSARLWASSALAKSISSARSAVSARITTLSFNTSKNPPETEITSSVPSFFLILIDQMVVLSQEVLSVNKKDY